MKNIILSFFLLLISGQSCTSSSANDEKYRVQIVGLWKFVDNGFLYGKELGEDEVSWPFEHNFKVGYLFRADGTCDNMQGFYSFDNKITEYEGRDTRYEIKDGELIIFGRNIDIWRKQTIQKISSDSLFFTYPDSTYSIFVRVKELEKPFEFDDIVVASSYCYGTCPANNLYIKKTGEIIFEGIDYNTKNGLYRGRIDSAHLAKLKSEFLYVDIDTLQNKYKAPWTDSQTISAGFLKDGKIIKIIEDYSMQSPTELQWALLPFRYLYQQVELEELKDGASDADYVEMKKVYWGDEEKGMIIQMLIRVH